MKILNWNNKNEFFWGILLCFLWWGVEVEKGNRKSKAGKFREIQNEAPSRYSRFS